MLKTVSLRQRLTFLSTALVGITLTSIGVVLYFYIQQSSYDRLDSELRERTAEVTTALGRDGLTIPDPVRLDIPPIYVQLLSPTGLYVTGSQNMGRGGRLPIDDSAVQTTQHGQAAALRTTLSNGVEMDMLYTPVSVGGATLVGIIEVATPVAPVEGQLAQLRLVLLATGLLALTLVGFGTWWTTGRAFRAVDRIAATAHRIEISQDLSQRIPSPADAPDDEMSRLVHTFNNMLFRLDAAFQAQKQFVADSSHELRSPLTVIRGNLDLWRRARNDEDRQAAVTAIEQETARMTRLVENLLFLAQSEARPTDMVDSTPKELVELDSLLLTVYQQARIIGHDHHITLAHEDVATVRGDRDQLQQLLLNLVDNAIKYTPAGGAISLGLYADEPWARLEVADSGIGIPADDLPHIFDRFYRSDKARSRTMGGAGLGLAIVREVAESYGGRVEVFSTLGQGTLFRVWLPMAAPDTASAHTGRTAPLLPMAQPMLTGAPVMPANGADLADLWGPPPRAVPSATNGTPAPVAPAPLIGRSSDDSRGVG
jgi:two-component system OmpR family sensor kinase